MEQEKPLMIDTAHLKDTIQALRARIEAIRDSL